MKYYNNVMFVGLLLSFCSSGVLCAYVQTIEEKELLEKAREQRFHNMSGVVRTIKSAWSVLEAIHPGVYYNGKIHEQLSVCWQRSYGINDSSASVKITRRDIMDIFQQNLNEINPNLSFFQKSSALRAMSTDANSFVRNHVQAQFLETVEQAQKLILKNIRPYITSVVSQTLAGDTEQVFKHGMRFLLLTLLNKQKKIDRDDERFVDAKVSMFIHEMGKQYPYVSALQYESWVFSLLNDLFFGECVVCMDKRSDTFMACCKSKSICKTCYLYVANCPLCRAPKPTY